MTRRSVKNIAASVRARLDNRARTTGRPHQEVVQFFAMERFLYRLSRSPYRERLILKGALMLLVWHGTSRRPTRDIDLLGRIASDPDHIAKMVRDVCTQTVEPDGIEFDPASVRTMPIAEDVEYVGVRVQFLGRLDTIRLHMQVDLGFGDQVFPEPLDMAYPTVLDLPAPRLLMYLRETAIAEKFHVMLVRERLNSRMKDYFDIWWLAKHFDFKGEHLAEAIRRTCRQRKTVIPRSPAGLNEEFGFDAAKAIQWRAFREQMRMVDVPSEFSDAASAVSGFLNPVVRGISEALPFRLIWHPPGPWTAP